MDEPVANGGEWMEFVYGASDGLKLDREEFATALDTYYQQSGWDVESGIPTRPTLERLELGWVADQIGA